MKHRFHQLDVFTAQALRGNPVAVVHDAQGLSEERMTEFARWTNLSETTFLLPPSDPEADYRLRIFTPGGELPFAGHPTLGSCQAWLMGAGSPRRANEVVQECAVGLVRIRRAGARLAFAAPPLQRSAVEPQLLAQVLKGLGLDATSVRAAQWLDNGPLWLTLLLHDAATVLALRPDHAALKTLAKVGVAGPQLSGADSHFEVRAFAAAVGIDEDPVTGSLNAGLAQWLIADGLAPAHYVAAQGTVLQRAGRVRISSEGGEIWVGGDVQACIEGTVDL